MAGVRQFDEGEMLDKALALFWKKGYADTSMQELAAATGVQRGSLYNAYQDKETLFLRVFEVYAARFLEGARRTLEAPRLDQALEAFFAYVIASMTTGTPTRGCLSTKTAVAGDRIDEPIRQALAAMLDRFEAVLAARLAQPDPEVEPSVPAKEAAALIITFTRGIVVIERVYQEPRRLHDNARTLVAMLLRPRRAAAAPA
ncbi:TetR/AcrR family transcriptional regulator [Burkholderia gladioli]|uniref:TetR/AcrR family transcriptional regulator n=1 Tax=Burkholderia gladioli TaxID=28095 RepID=UPI001640680D|nr:TetR/AcrR family transcriptional regulator [Burkholderia gladioli]